VDQEGEGSGYGLYPSSEKFSIFQEITVHIDAFLGSDQHDNRKKTGTCLTVTAAVQGTTETYVTPNSGCHNYKQCNCSLDIRLENALQLTNRFD
jgi:hypothetical protein